MVLNEKTLLYMLFKNLSLNLSLAEYFSNFIAFSKFLSTDLITQKQYIICPADYASVIQVINNNLSLIVLKYLISINN